MVPETVHLEMQTYLQNESAFQKFLRELAFPFPFLLMCCITGYLLLVGILWLIVQTKTSKRDRTRRMATIVRPFDCCPCCLSVADACNFCRMTSLDACLNGICPQRKVSNLPSYVIILVTFKWTLCHAVPFLSQ